VVAGLAVALSACSSSGSKSSSTTQSTTAPTAAPGAGGGGGGGITIANFSFTAGSVAAGSTVTVTNNDSPTHTVTADDGSFDVTVNPGKTATFTAPAKAGTYKFHCKIHSTMHGTLTVT
ncbi:MAG TPA: cupredoxin domain-containing protein, partial [Acidimicrobiia bacterium]